MLSNEEFIQEFSDYLKYERNYSNLTNEAYLEDIKDFVDFLEETGESNLLEVNLTDTRIYLSALTDEKYSRSSISRKISSLRAFYQYLLNHDFIHENPFSYLYLKKTGLRLPNFL